MRVTLISLYHFESFAIRLLQAVLEEEGFEVDSVFLKDLRTNRISEPSARETQMVLDHLRRSDSKLAAISVRSPFRPVARELTRSIRAELGIPVVWGGADATLCPDQAIAEAEAVCLGEGERTLPALAKALISGADSKVPGAWVCRGDRIEKSPPNPVIENLDELPFPVLLSDRKLFIEDDQVKEDPLLENTRYDIMASRGCAFACAYCCSPALAVAGGGGRRIRKRSVENVLAELELVKSTLPQVRRIFFVDEIFGLDKDWAEEFASGYKSRIGLPFICEFYPTTIKEDTVRLLAGAGLEGVSVGIQSGDPKIRSEHLRRPVSDEQLLSASRLLKQHGVRPTYDIIMEMPFVGEPELKRTFELVSKLERPFDLNLFSLINFPGTELTEKLLASGAISEDEVEGFDTKSWSRWRIGLDAHGDRFQLFYNCLTSLLSKSFIPGGLVVLLSRSAWLRRHPRPLVIFSSLANLAKSGSRGMRMLVRGQLNLGTFRRYARNLTVR